MCIYSNVAEAVVSKGLATVVRYRQDDDQRSSRYDELLAAEMKAQKTFKGMHDKKEAPTHRVADLAGVDTKLLKIAVIYGHYRIIDLGCRQVQAIPSFPSKSWTH